MQRKATRIFLIALAAILIFILVLQILVSLFGDQYAGEKIKQKVRESSHKKYALMYDDLNIGLVSRSITFNNLQLISRNDTTAQADTTSQNNNITGTAKQVNIAGIGLWNYFFNNTLSVKSIVFEEPHFVVTPGNPKPTDQKPDQPSFSTIDSSLFAAVSKQFKAFRLDHFSIKNGEFLLLKKGAPKDSSKWVHGMNLKLDNILVDSSSAKSGRYFITDNIELNIQKYGQHISDNFYKLSLGNIAFSSSEQRFTADSLQFLPRYPKYEFSRKKGMEIDRFTLMVPHINLVDINVDQSINNKLLYARSGKIDHPSLQVFHDKSMPSPPPHGNVPLPQTMFKQLGTKIKLDTLTVTNGSISYAEQKAELNKPGKISFDSIDATFSGISNYEEELNNEHVVKIKTKAKVMDAGLLKATFKFPMGHNNGQHSIQGSLGRIKASAFNKASENIALARFTDGIIYSLNFNMNLNAYGAQGNLVLDYENFKIEMLKIKSKRVEGHKVFKSFLANTFALKNSNHEPPLKKATIKFERKEQKSIFNLWWKALMVGLKEQVKIF